jgi:hypothetical protein
MLKMRQVTGNSGEVTNIGDNREWSQSTEDGGMVIEKTQVMLSSEHDYSAIKIRKYYKAAAYFAYTLGFFVSATATGIALDGDGLSDLVNLGIVTGGGLSGLAAVRAGLALWSQKQKKRLRNLADSLYNLASPELDSEISTESSPSGIDVPAVETDTHSTLNSERRRSRS